MIARAAATLALLLILAPITPVLGQEPKGSVKTFESPSFGIKTNYPANWAADTSKADGGEFMGVDTGLVSFCPEEHALPEIGSKFSCEDSNDIIGVFLFRNLDLSSAFSVIENPNNITLDDVFAHTLQIFRNVGYEDRNRDFRIINQTDTTVNITTGVPVASDAINQTQELPARLYEFTYRPAIGDTEVRSLSLIVLNGMNAYAVNYEYIDVLNLVERLNATGFMPEPAKVVFDSFELISAGDAAAGTSGAPTTPAQLVADITTSSSSKTTDAYTPNPIRANVGDTVTWTNRDSTPHTVTSGTAVAPDGNFDSSPGFNPLMAPQATFSHTFTEPGEYPYYCGLHPNMVGTVVVTGTSSGQPQPSQAVPSPDESSSAILDNITEGVQDFFGDTASP